LLKKYYISIAIFLIALYTIINLYCYPKLSPTGDEINYYAYAVNIIKGNPQKEMVNGKPQFNTQMPIAVLNTLPRIVQQIVNPSLQKTQATAQQDIINGRLISIFISILLALYVLQWSTQLYGKMAGLFSLSLLLLCPNTMAHSQLAGTDVYSFFIAIAFCFHLWKYNKTNDYWQLFLLAFFLALGQIAKQSLLLFYPMVLLLLFNKKNNIRYRFVNLFKVITTVAIVSILVINIGFLFNNTGKKWGDYNFASQRFQKLQQTFTVFNNLPIPLPQPYVQSFDYAAFNEETPPGIEKKSSYGQGYLLGKPVGGKPYPTYYLICIAYKLPIATIIILIAAFIFYFINRKQFSFVNNEVFLVIPALFFLVAMSIGNSMYLGVRNVLLILPLLFVFAGSIVNWIWQRRSTKIILGSLLCWQFISVAKYFPHFIPYTNEFIWDKKNAYKIFGDANLFYQEGRYMVQDYLQKNPTIQFEPTTPVKGKVLVSIEHYYDWWHHGKMKWLTDLKLEPIDHFDSEYLLFDIK
jgi:hypothetical protein